MRIGFNSSYLRFTHNQESLQHMLHETQKQISSGKKIQFGFENSNIFNETLRLDYENTNLVQGKEVAQKAKKFSDNTDTALSQLSLTMDRFKEKLIQAANQMHSDVSRLAIANDLEAMKNHFKSLANSSVGGEYLFSGSAITTPPIKHDGTYAGNNENLKGLVASNNQLTYNITGEELFFGKDSDHKKILTTNIKNYNQRELHPYIMEDIEKARNPEEIFIKESDTIRDLIGDNDDDHTNDTEEFFYLQGRRSDGTFFKSKFAIERGYSDEKSAAKVSDLLDKIGIEFGNTSITTVVDVRLNAWGQIEITDLKAGSSSLEFHMLSSDKDVSNVDELLQSGAKIKEYTKSNYNTLKSLDTIGSTNDYYDHRIHKIETTFKTEDNAVANYDTKLEDLFGVDVETLRIAGNKVSPDGEISGDPVSFDVAIAGRDVRSVVNEIKEKFSTSGAPKYDDIRVEFINGKFVITDNSVKNLKKDVFAPPFDGPSFFNISFQTLDATNNPKVSMSNNYTVEYDRVRFEKNGSRLVSNTPQIVRKDNSFAKDSTKLSEVSGRSLHNQEYIMEIKDVNSKEWKVHLNLSNNGTTYYIEDKNNNRFPPLPDNYILYAPGDEAKATRADDVTYKQLTDVMTLALNFTNVSAGVEPGSSEDLGGKSAYENALIGSKSYVDVSLNQRGIIDIHDRRMAYTKAEFSIYNSEANIYPPNGDTQELAMLSIHSNNALVVDDPHVDFFKSIDEAITAVREDIYRPDGFNAEDDFDANVRNIGIQNSIKAIEHLASHVNKLHTQNGAQGNALQYAIEKNEVLSVHVRSLRSEVIDTDLAESAMQLSQITLSFQAALQTTAKVNSLSIVNYI